MKRTVITASAQGDEQEDAADQTSMAAAAQPVPAPNLPAPRLPMQMLGAQHLFSRLSYTPPKMISNLSENIGNDLFLSTPLHFAGDGSDCLSESIEISVRGSSRFGADMRNVDADINLIIKSISESFLDGRLPPFKVSCTHALLGQMSMGGHPPSMPVYSYCLDFTNWGSRGCVLPPPSYPQTLLSIERFNEARGESFNEYQWIPIPLEKLLGRNAENDEVERLEWAATVPADHRIDVLPAHEDAGDCAQADDGCIEQQEDLWAGLADHDAASGVFLAP
ncbi:MAG: hypothetical protein RR320_07495 [Oscillospiraceae bacterium]